MFPLKFTSKLRQNTKLERRFYILGVHPHWRICFGVFSCFLFNFFFLHFFWLTFNELFLLFFVILRFFLSLILRWFMMNPVSATTTNTVHDSSRYQADQYEKLYYIHKNDHLGLVFVQITWQFHSWRKLVGMVLSVRNK